MRVAAISPPEAEAPRGYPGLTPIRLVNQAAIAQLPNSRLQPGLSA